jgi:curved DNA-binding protein CbpA
VNDAYYTLSDASRRRDYDAQRKIFGGGGFGTGSGGNKTGYTDPFAEAEGSDTDEGVPPPNPGTGGFPSWAWNFFTGNKNGGAARQHAEDTQFGDVFEEMLREEGMAEPGTNRPTRAFWSVVGGVSGGALGFIVANVPGALAGAVAGNRLGAVRDAKGKSVYSVFQELPQDDRARLLSQLAARVLSHAVGI